MTFEFIFIDFAHMKQYEKAIKQYCHDSTNRITEWSGMEMNETEWRLKNLFKIKLEEIILI